MTSELSLENRGFQFVCSTDMQLTMGTVLKAFVVAADSRLYKPMAFAE